MLKYKYFRSAIFRTAQTPEGINIFCLYNDKISPEIIQKLSLELLNFLSEKGISYTFNQVEEWIKARFNFSKHNHPDKNAEVFIKNNQFIYKTESAGGSVNLKNTIFCCFGN